MAIAIMIDVVVQIDCLCWSWRCVGCVGVVVAVVVIVVGEPVRAQCNIRLRRRAVTRRSRRSYMGLLYDFIR